MDSTLLLHSIIKNLTAQETKHIELHLGAEDDSLIASLYFLIKELNHPSDDYLEPRWKLLNKKQPLTLKSLENSKSRLKSKLLQLLQQCNINTLGGEAEQLLNIAEIYIQKHLFDTAYNTLNNFFVSEHPLTKPIYKIQIIQKLIWLLPICVKENITHKQQTYLDKLSAAIAELNLFQEIYIYNLKISTIATKNGVLKDAELLDEVNQLKQNPLHFNNLMNLPHLHASYLTKSNTLLAQLTGEDQKQYELQKTLCAIMHTNELVYIESGSYINYMAEHINLTLLSAQHGDAKILQDTLFYIRKLTVQDKPINAIFSLQADFAETMFYYYQNTLYNHRPLLEKCDANFKKIVSTIPASISLSLRYGLMKCWLHLGEYKKVEEWYMNRPAHKPLIKFDSYFIIYLIQLCGLYEQYEIDLKEKEINLPKSYLKQAHQFSSLHTMSKSLLPVENSVHNTFEKLGKEKKLSIHVQILSKLDFKLNSLSKSEPVYVKQFYKMFHLQNWIKKMLTHLKQKTAD